MRNPLIALVLSWLFVVPAFAQSTLKVQSTNTTLKNNLTVKGSIYVTQLVNSAIKSKMLSIDIGANNALANSTTYISSAPVGRACQIIQVSVSAQTAPVGGTNTLTVLKNNTTPILAATFNPATLTSNTATIIPLNATVANLQLLATDTLTVTWTSGVQTTAAVGPSVTVELVPTAEY